MNFDRPPPVDYLAFAAYRGVVQDVMLYLRKLPQTVNEFSAGRTPVLWAISGGHYDVMVMLEKYGANLESRTTDGQSALTCAVRSRSERMVKAMLEKGFDLAEKDKQGKTALDWARTMQKTDLINLLEEPTRAAIEKHRAAEAARKRGILKDLARRRKIIIRP